MRSFSNSLFAIAEFCWESFSRREVYEFIKLAISTFEARAELNSEIVASGDFESLYVIGKNTYRCPFSDIACSLVVTTFDESDLSKGELSYDKQTIHDSNTDDSFGEVLAKALGISEIFALVCRRVFRNSLHLE